MGDEVLLDLIVLANKRIMPFTSQENLRIRLEEDSIQPGFGSKLVGTLVGATEAFPYQMTLEEGGLQNIAFVIEIKMAASLEFPEATAPETLQQFEMGDTIEEIYGNIAESLGNEREGAKNAKGMAMALDAIADRCEIEIEEEHVEDEIRTQWSNNEGRFLQEKGMAREDMNFALEGWRQDEGTRETAHQRLKITSAVLMYAALDPQELTEEEVDGFFRDHATSNGINIDEWRESIEDKPEEQLALLNEYLYLRTVTHLISEINIEYED